MRSKNRDSYPLINNVIALDEATDLPAEFYALMEKWKKQADQKAKGNDVNWFSKDVSINFTYQEKMYRLIAEDFFSEEIVDKMNCGKLNCGYYHAVVETLQAPIKNDLLEMGATNVSCYGFLD